MMKYRACSFETFKFSLEINSNLSLPAIDERRISASNREDKIPLFFKVCSPFLRSNEQYFINLILLVFDLVLLILEFHSFLHEFHHLKTQIICEE